MLQRASCLAQKYNLVVVLDMADQQVATAPSGTSAVGDKDTYEESYEVFNTQVAFSETGELLAKYHKSHLYYEPEWSPGILHSLQTFFTHPRFGLFWALLGCFGLFWVIFGLFLGDFWVIWGCFGLFWGCF